ncbi:MAG: hypothetical protein MJZ09_05170, partial [Bacteroidales bacterium]|nr:hypothetical protein [Bacteroidales bacterium]
KTGKIMARTTSDCIDGHKTGKIMARTTSDCIDGHKIDQIMAGTTVSSAAIYQEKNRDSQMASASL